MSGCKNVTDKVLIKLSMALGKNTKTLSCKKNTECCLQYKAFNNGSISNKLINIENIRQLKTLRLSGCFKITDVGLR